MITRTVRVHAGTPPHPSAEGRVAASGTRHGAVNAVAPAPMTMTDTWNRVGTAFDALARCPGSALAVRPVSAP